MKQLDKRAVWLFFVNFILRVLIPVAAACFYGAVILGDLGIISTDLGSSFWSAAGAVSFFSIVVIFSAVVSFAWAKLTYHFYRYELTDAGFRKESGIVYKKYVTIPYERIQNIDIHRGIVARLLGLSDLSVQTAGLSATVNGYGISGVGSEGYLPGLAKEVAEQLRDELVERARGSKGQGI